MAPVDREYLYGSLDHKICDQYLELFADFKYVRSFWDGALAPLHFLASRRYFQLRRTYSRMQFTPLG
jgi:hypothetical protein